MKILTSFDYPPIPVREYDWSATTDNYDCSWEGEETGYVANEPVGHGATEAEAIADLNAQLYEDREHEPHNPLCSATSNCTICWPEDSADLGSEDIEDEYVDPREEYADQVGIKLRGEL